MKSMDAIAKAALVWYAADEQRRVAATARRRAHMDAAGAPSLGPEGHALSRADARLAEARKIEQAARRALKRECAGPKAINVQVKEIPATTTVRIWT